ncbi:hypothetical protein CBM2594_U70007 [Cupriavidus taiwanensis]|uniref:Uncharacterized protein n=1 Tax=Cupriavidus taiwanensis TaxID=164546 RepID=A0A7Z7JJL8_9BURK|nr:hypothetical protein CBM2594_U70007 [Cupriavidus taiwanensis]
MVSRQELRADQAGTAGRTPVPAEDYPLVV